MARPAGVVTCCFILASLGSRPAAADGSFLDLYLRALESDPAFQQARLERDISLEGVRETRAGVMPVLSANLEGFKVYQDIRESSNLLFQVGTADFVDERFGLVLTQPIYRAEVLRRLPQSQALVRRSEARLGAAEQDLMVRLAEAVFNAMAARDVLEFATAERTSIQRQLEESEQRLGSGLATITDVHDARARFEDAQAKEIEAQDALDAALLGIAEITGEVPDRVGVLADGFPLVEPEPAEEEAWVRMALFQNLDLEGLKEEVEAAQQEVQVQKSARMPNLDLVARFSATDQGGSVFLGGGGSKILTSDFGVRMDIPIYDGGLWSARARAAMLRAKVALQDLELARRRVDRDTRVAFQGVVSGVTRVRALQRAVFSQDRALESTQESFRAGLATGRAVLDASRDLFSARRDHSRARYVYVLQTLRLKQSTGSLGLDDMRQISAGIE
jgi:outer membrane protein